MPCYDFIVKAFGPRDGGWVGLGGYFPCEEDGWQFHFLFFPMLVTSGDLRPNPFTPSSTPTAGAPGRLSGPPQIHPCLFLGLLRQHQTPFPPSSTPDSWSPRSPQRPPRMQMLPNIPDRARIGGDRSKSSNFAIFLIFHISRLEEMLGLLMRSTASRTKVWR